MNGNISDSSNENIKYKPNILWVVLDHVTFRHYKMTKGAKPILNTYERLASKGVEFTNCHSVQPLCLPARASMMTGVYAHKHGKKRNDEQEDSCFPLISEFMDKLGYNMAYFGKNHSGYEDLSRFGFEGFYPKSYGNPYKTMEYRKYLDENNLENPIFYQEWGMETDRRLYENGEYDLTKDNNFNTYSSGYFKTKGPVHEADFLISLADNWLDKHMHDKEPFLLRVDTWGPHHSYQIPLDFINTINAKEIEEYPSFKEKLEHKPEFVRDYFTKIKNRNKLETWEDWQPIMKRAYENYSYIDTALGRLIDKLEKERLADKTIIILTADHGDSLGSHGGMFDKAGDLMEELMHIPMVICGPGVLKNAKYDEHVSNLDIVPTILDMVGIKPPEYMDGRSMAGLLKGDDFHWRDDFMSQHYGHFDAHSIQRALYYKNYKYIVTTDDVDELYDLDKDPFEMVNLVNCPEMKDVLYGMRKRLKDYMDNHEDSDMKIKTI